MSDYADQLITELDTSDCWPLHRERKVVDKILERRAWRVGEADRLKLIQGWDLDRRYIHDALAKRVAAGFADFLFGADPEITATVDTDQSVINEIVEDNQLPARLHRAERMIVSEGEQWWKLHVNIAVAKVPLLTWTSRRFVVPLLHGDVVLAAAFVTERARTMETYRQGDEDPCEVVWRHAEVHTAGRVINVLYRGLPDQLGARVDLTQRSETAGLNPEWAHGLPMLAGRVVNDLDDDDCLGVSEYDQITDELLALDEAITIGDREHAPDRDRPLFVAGKLVTPDDGLRRQPCRSSRSTPPAASCSARATVAADRADREALRRRPAVAAHRKLVRTILSRVGLVAEVVGDDSQGHEYTGPAIRLRFLPTTNAANGKLREWRHDLPHILSVMLQLAQPAHRPRVAAAVTSL
jgi:hypothetical protein